MLVELFGRTFNLYEGSSFPYDVFSHAAIVGLLVSFGVLLLYAFLFEHDVDYDSWFVIVVGLLLGLGIGGLWEIYEWGADQLVGTSFQKGNMDTMRDLAAGAVGSLIGSFAARRYRHLHTREEIMEELPIFYEWL
jgi:hypothetical protein